MRDLIHLSTAHREMLVDITGEVGAIVTRSGVRDGLVNVYAQGATAAIMVQENWDESVQTDVVHLLQTLILRAAPIATFEVRTDRAGVIGFAVVVEDQVIVVYVCHRHHPTDWTAMLRSG